MKCKYCDCYIPDGTDVCPSCHKKQGEANDNDEKDTPMKNSTVKRNLLVLLEEFVTRCIASDKDNARKTVVLAIKAIDAYGKPLDEE